MSNFSATHSPPKHKIYQATTEAGEKSPSLETTFLELSCTTGKEMAPSFMERMMAAHTGNNANEDATSTLVESDSDNSEDKSQLPSTSVVKPLSNTGARSHMNLLISRS